MVQVRMPMLTLVISMHFNVAFQFTIVIGLLLIYYINKL